MYINAEFIDHNGKKILSFFPHMAKNDIPVFMEEAKKMVSSNPPRSVLFLADVYKMSFDKTTVKHLLSF